MNELIFATQNLSKRFGALAVADNISIELRAGERRALIGPNGAGKTTFVAMVSGAVRPDSGKIFLNGIDITKERPDRRVRRGLVRTFQISSLFPQLTVLENIFLAVSAHCRASGRMLRRAADHRELVERAEDIVAQLSLYEDRNRPASKIPYGRQRLIEVGIALSLEPKVLILDEPAAGIPSDQASLLLRVLEELPRNIAIIMIEHDMQLVRRFASSVSILVNGSVLMTGTPQEVMSSEQVHSVYLGHSGRARFDAKTVYG
jgi:branched-chain amino acid transport system ATP-binding protein